MDDLILETRGLTKEFRGFTAVHAVDLRIRRGKIDRARDVLELLHRHYQIKDAQFPQRGELAYIALERVASGVGFASLSERER